MEDSEALTAAQYIKRIGAVLLAKRIELNLQQERLAARAQISVGAVKNIEAGSGASLGSLLAVVCALGMHSWLEQIGTSASLTERRNKDGELRTRAHQGHKRKKTTQQAQDTA